LVHASEVAVVPDVTRTNRTIAGARRFVRALTPPIVISVGRRLQHWWNREQPMWEYVPEGWARESATTGWDVDEVVERYRAKLSAYRAAIRPPSPIGVSTEALFSTELNLHEHNIAMVFAYSLAISRVYSNRLSVLDWGGGVGYLSYLARSLMPDVDFDYHVRELSSVAAAGRTLVSDVTFWDDDQCLGREYDLVVASSSLQYERDWPVTLDRFVRSARRYLLLTRVPIVKHHPSFVVLQRAYGTEYLGWCINETDLVATAERAGAKLVREFRLFIAVHADGAPEADEHRAYLFRCDGREDGTEGSA